MYKDLGNLMRDAKGTLSFNDKKLEIIDESEVKRLVDEWIYAYVFGKGELKKVSGFLIRATSQALGIYPASIYEFYRGRGKGEYGGFTVPAINLRGLTYDIGRRVFRVANRLNSSAFILEIARSEMGYTDQPPDEYVAALLAAAIKESYQGPLFIQGDHFQMKSSPSLYEEEIKAQRELITEAIDAGFFNIDIDASTLVDITKESLREQQKLNSETTAYFTRFIREIEPKDITVSLGGEIGEIGGRNSTPEDLEAFMEGYLEEIGDLPGIIKIAIQTGTRHGGVVLPDGTLAKVKVDFDTLRRLSLLARERYHMAGAVQHGASTLPLEVFHLFPQNEAVEIHLATEFQNIIYDSPELPEDFKNSIYEFLKEKFGGERKPDETEKQFIYRTRKKGFGPFKKDWWNLPGKEVKGPILDRLEGSFEIIFESLHIGHTKELVLQKAPMRKYPMETPKSLMEERI